MAEETHSHASQRRLGDLLCDSGAITPDDVAKALAFQQQFGGRIGTILVRLGAMSEETLLQALSAQLDIPIAAQTERPLDSESIRRVVESSKLVLDWWIDNGAVAWALDDGGIIASARDVLDPTINEVLQRHLETQGWQWRLLHGQDLDRYLDMLAGLARPTGDGLYDDVSHLRELAEEAPVIELVNNLLAQAMDSRASDVHIEPEETLFHVRMRIDGILQLRMTLPI